MISPSLYLSREGREDEREIHTDSMLIIDIRVK